MMVIVPMVALAIVLYLPKKCTGTCPGTRFETTAVNAADEDLIVRRTQMAFALIHQETAISGRSPNSLLIEVVAFDKAAGYWLAIDIYADQSASIGYLSQGRAGGAYSEIGPVRFDVPADVWQPFLARFDAETATHRGDSLPPSQLFHGTSITFERQRNAIASHGGGVVQEGQLFFGISQQLLTLLQSHLPPSGRPGPAWVFPSSE